MQTLLKIIVLTALMIIIPIVWWQSLSHLSSLKGIMLSTGASFFLFGLSYKLMGSWDLIPDWIPILGSLDDSFAWIIMILGALIGGGGFYLH